ncbi:hypothetical protein F5Y06DRAFT_265452 [Hypoxylon sp. FL0890]|nr:hypothetical protein F5Y06DRAFT_265452 [Hypoxylon sp. FL0890]
MSDQSPETSQDATGDLLRKRRLLEDIKELVETPYPNITLHTYDHDILKACLVLTPTDYKPLHMSVRFSTRYPLDPPVIKMDTSVSHPNVIGDYICATILRRTDDHTPAYTLKGIAIQLLSFFSSNSVEQEYGGSMQLDAYRAQDEALLDSFECQRCHFGKDNRRTYQPARSRYRHSHRREYDARVTSSPEQWPDLQGKTESPPGSCQHASPTSEHNVQPEVQSEVQDWIQLKNVTTCGIDHLPNELLLLVLEKLDFEQMTNFARAWPRVSDVIRDFDVVRQRELQCFCLKQDYRSVKLGIGVSIRRGRIASEFDLLSQDAYRDWCHRRSINNIPFEHWLPLPISHQHWQRVKGNVNDSLGVMVGDLRKVGAFGQAQVLFTFMNDVVVRLNQVADEKSDGLQKSNLRHASEKAIDSYFHLFHLLVCLATEDHFLVEHANSLLRNFMNGKQSKEDCPNLGHLLIALLISDIEVTEALMKAIITEAITRNVVWLFDRKGAFMPELSYMEPVPVSSYRLDKTFQGSQTSYRLLMFSELFRRTARPSHEKPLTQVRDELFDRHGAPPRNAAQELSETVRRLHTIDNFPAFLKEMGLDRKPDPRYFTDMLRQTVYTSMSRGYSTWGMPKKYALLLRVKKDRGLWINRRIWMSGDDARWVEENWKADPLKYCRSFFPNNRR